MSFGSAALLLFHKSQCLFGVRLYVAGDGSTVFTLRFHYLVSEDADACHLDFANITGQKPIKRPSKRSHARCGAGGDDIAWVELGEGCDISDEVGEAEDKILI